MDLLWLAKQNCSHWASYEIMESRPNFEAVPPKHHIFLIALYSLTAAFALVANLLTLLVLRASKRTSRNLAKYLINLSVADLLMAALIPFTYTDFMYGRWYLHPGSCAPVKALEFCSVFISCYTLIAVGIDRHIAIKTPIRSKTRLVNLTNFILAGIWLLGLALAAAILLLYRAAPADVCGRHFFVCHFAYDLQHHLHLAFAIGNLATIYVVPALVLTYVYSSMALVMFRRDVAVASSSASSTMLREQRRKVIKVLMVVVASFLLCWTPLQCFVLVAIATPSARTFSTEWELNRYVYTYFAFHWLAMAHSTLNPVIYSFCSASFRQDFMHLFCRGRTLSQVFSSSGGSSSIRNGIVSTASTATTAVTTALGSTSSGGGGGGGGSGKSITGRSTTTVTYLDN